jgi:asparagine synthase (glutamine-hydrolysing)
MPGIAGVISSKSAGECERMVTAMIATMKHEPFYESGACSAPAMGVYAGWTAHPRSFAARESAAGQPPNRDLMWVWSGECAGETVGVDIATSYIRLGDGFVRELNGLFSGLLIDRDRGRILLFNDRYGLERIYFHQTTDALYFASEAKALLEVLPGLRAFDDAGVAQFLAFGCTHGQQTLFRGVSLLEGGSLWSFERGESRKHRYVTPECLEQQPVMSLESFNDEFATTFRRALPRYVGDGDGVGISLTAGLDTRMIMACLPPTSTRPVTYTFSGQSERTLDERIAARVAATCGLDHRVLRIGADFLSGYGGYIDKTVYVTDGSFGATGAHEIYLNAKARQLASIRLTGNFGSEVLRSMSTFKPLGLSREMFRSDFGAVVASSARTVLGADHPVTFSVFKEIPSSLFGSLAAGRSQVTFRTPYLDNDIVSLAYRAPADARRSPDSALRLIGASDPRLGRIPTDRGVAVGGHGPLHVLRRLFAEVTFKLDYLHKEGLPHRLSRLDPAIGGLSMFGILGLHKYLPYRRWFRNELQAYVSQVFSEARTRQLPYWNAGFLKSMAEDHGTGRRNYVREINAVMTLEAVDRLLIRRAGARL